MTGRSGTTEPRPRPDTAPWPPVPVPTDRARRPGAAPRCRAVERTGLDASVAAGNPEPGPGRLPGIAAAAFAALLYRCTGQRRIALAVADGELRFTVDGAATVRELAARASGPGRAGGSAARPVVAFAAAAERMAAAAEADGAEPLGAPGAGRPPGAPFELRLVVRGRTAELHYDDTLFDRATARRLLGHYRTLLADALAAPERPVSRLRLLTDEELRRILGDWNRTQAAPPEHGCLHHAFEARADLAPHAVAVVHGERRLTYREINTAANRLAHHLRTIGVGPDVRVGLWLDRSPRLLVATLAVLKAGGAYVPLDPEDPPRRTAAIVAGASCAVVLGHGDPTGAPPVSATGAAPLLLDRDAAVIDRRPAHNPRPLAGPEQVCCVLPVPGPGGGPRPVALRHRGVLTTIADLNARYRVGSGDSVLALAVPGSPMSVYELLGLPLAGGVVVVPEGGGAEEPEHWARLLAEEGVTVWTSAPGPLGLLVDRLERTQPPPLHRLRLALVGGERVPAALPDRLWAFTPGLRFVALGGATGDAVHATCHEVEKVDPRWTSVPYGRPLANRRAYVLDAAMQPVPPGVNGELYLVGDGPVEDGPGRRTRDGGRFVTWGWPGVVAEERLYRTGAVARFGADGVIDRPERPGPAPAAAAPRAPAAAAEDARAAVFAEVLGVARVGVDEEVPAGDGGGGGGRAEPVAEPPADRESARFRALRARFPALRDVWPLTPSQAALFTGAAHAAGDPGDHRTQTIVELTGRVEARRMRAAARALLERYPNLRAAFVRDGAGEWAQAVLDGLEPPWREVDLSALSAAGRDRAFRALLAEDRATPFDPARPPLLRLALVRCGATAHRLLLTTHHALLDAWSEPVLLRDLLRLYADGGDASGLPAAPGLREYLGRPHRRDRAAASPAWPTEPTAVTAPAPLAGEAVPRAGAGGEAETDVGLSRAEWHRLLKCAAELGVTAGTLVQGAWGVLLGALTGRREVVFGATVPGRPAELPGVESMVGPFAATLPVRLRLDPGTAFGDLLTGLQEVRRRPPEPFRPGPPAAITPDAGGTARFETVVDFRSHPVDRAGIAAAAADGDIEVTGVRSEATAGHPLALVVRTDPALRLTLRYRTGAFTAEAAGTVAARLHAVLRQLTGDPSRRIAAVDVLLGGERERAGGPAQPIAAADEAVTLPTLIERRAAASPDAVAVRSGGEPLTYRQLNTWANRLAHQLIRRGGGPESVVALPPERSVRLAVAALAALKAGAAFVLAGAEGPLGAEHLVTRAAVDRLGSPTGDPADDLDPADADRTRPLTPRNLAWLRRPATGPVGGDPVALDHRAVTGRARRFAAAAGLGTGTRLLAASPDDEAMVGELLAALCAGAEATVPTDIAAFGAEWGWTGDVISTVAPFLDSVLARSGGALYAGTVVLTGPALPDALVRRLRAAIPRVRVVGTYGPPETAGAAAYGGPPAGPGAPDAAVAAGTADVATVATAATAAVEPPGVVPRPLGDLFGDLRCYVLDAALRPVAPGVTGELYVAGDVARGFREQPAVTARHFVADPYGPPGSRMYRTGDLVRRGREGVGELVGRTGDRPRVRERRATPAEVAAVLAAHPRVARATAAVRRPGAGAGLVGYVVPVPGGSGGELAEDVRAFAAHRLPGHLVPVAVVELPEPPPTAVGQADASALPDPSADDAADAGPDDGARDDDAPDGGGVTDGRVGRGPEYRRAPDARDTAGAGAAASAGAADADPPARAARTDRGLPRGRRDRRRRQPLRHGPAGSHEDAHAVYAAVTGGRTAAGAALADAGPGGGPARPAELPGQG